MFKLTFLFALFAMVLVASVSASTVPVNPIDYRFRAAGSDI